jgi:hypothetical protein
LGRPKWGRAKAAPDAIEKDAARPVARRAGREYLGRRIRPHPQQHRRPCPGPAHLPHDHSSLCHLANFGPPLWPRSGELRWKHGAQKGRNSTELRSGWCESPARTEGGCPNRTMDY